MNRDEMLLASVAGLPVDTLPEPRTREELFLANLAGCGPAAEDLPEPRTRKEMLLSSICTSGGGGGAPAVVENDVNFYDYDGTLMYSYSADELLALAELPDIPDNGHLVGQEWNWPLEELKEQVRLYGACDVGATRVPADGATRLYVSLPWGRLEPTVCISGAATIDWGDGTEPYEFSSNASHVYEAPGDYVITLSGDSAFSITGSSAAYRSGALFCKTNAINSLNRSYASCVTRIEFGNNIYGVGTKSLAYFCGLETISFPKSLASYVTDAIYSTNLRCLVLPRGVAISDGGSGGSISLANHAVTCLPYGITRVSTGIVGKLNKRITLPYTVTDLGTYTFAGATSLLNVVIPSGVAKIPAYAFDGCNKLESVTFPETATHIYDYVFRSCYMLTSLHFKSAVPPTMTTYTIKPANQGSALVGPGLITVPKGSLEAYTTATNYPSAAGYTYVEED